jgi:S-adenosylmethionine-dependent methyltransferase
MDLRHNIEQALIHRHIGGQRLCILDAGGGNGRSAIAFARQGHKVSLVDFSTEMLADGRRTAEEIGIMDRIEFHHAEIAEIPALFPDPTFDLVLCHNVVQYVDDVTATLRAVCSPLRGNGVISLVTVNGYSEVYKAAFRELDLDKASALLDGGPMTATLFGVPVRQFTNDELCEFLKAAGCIPIGRYGVRCLCDWLPNEPKYDPAFLARLEQLELALADRYPYNLLARFFQIVARKTG